MTAPPDRMPPWNVLFLCTGNSARSILAESLLRHRGAGRFVAHSAGSFPKGQVHKLVLRLLEEKGLPVAGLRSKSWDEFATPAAAPMDFVVTVCDHAAGELCPIWPGHPVTAHWGIPDPAAADGSEAERMLAFRAAFAQLDRRIRLLLERPLARPDPVALRRDLAAIGAHADHDAAP